MYYRIVTELYKATVRNGVVVTFHTAAGDFPALFIADTPDEGPIELFLTDEDEVVDYNELADYYA